MQEPESAHSGADPATVMPPHHQAWLNAVLGHVSESLLEMYPAAIKAGLASVVIESPKEIADRMIAAVPGVDPLSLELGTFYTAAGLAAWMGVSRQHVHELRRQNRIIGLTTADGRVLYPSFQFTTRAAPIASLQEVLPILHSVVDEWTAAKWFVTPNRDLEEMTPADWSRKRRKAPVIAAANRYAEIFASA